MTPLWLFLIPYTMIAFGIHGGEFITGINRQVRNLLCAIPFGLVGALFCPYVAGFLFGCSFFGANMGFDKHPLWLKGLITFPPLGAVILPFAYTVFKKPANQEYYSGFLYGAVLATIALVKALV